MGLVFDGAKAGQELFSTWLEAAGNEDARDEIRISIIEGDIPGQNQFVDRAFCLAAPRNSRFGNPPPRGTGLMAVVGADSWIGKV